MMVGAESRTRRRHGNHDTHTSEREKGLSRWIVSLLVALVVAIVVDRIEPAPAPEPEPPAIAAAAVRPEPSFAAGLISPIEPARILEVRPVAMEDGSDEAGAALHLVAARGTPVMAPVSGSVLAVTHLTSAGLAVDLLEDDGTRVVRLGHLLRLAAGVQDDKKVLRGDIIGWVGDSGTPQAGEYVLHVSVRDVPADGRWWQGRPLLLGTTTGRIVPLSPPVPETGQPRPGVPASMPPPAESGSPALEN